MKLGEKIKLLRTERKYTMQTLADKAGLTKGYISMLEKDENPQTGKPIIPSLETIQNIAVAFDMDLDTLLKDTDSQIQLPKVSPTSTLTLISETSSKLDEVRRENVLEYAEMQLEEQEEAKKVTHINEELYPYLVTEKTAAASGLPNGYSYDPDSNKTFTVYSDREITKHYDIATQVTGDSMEPKYLDGDIVLIQKGYDNWNGGIYIVDYDGKTYLKKIYLEDNHFRLVSLNKKYDDIIINLPVDETLYFNIVGKVVDSFTPVEVLKKKQQNN